jgi:membrane protease YdiL (CAAX protease family)
MSGIMELGARIPAFARVRVRWIPAWVIGGVMLALITAQFFPASDRTAWEDVLGQTGVIAGLGLWALRQLHHVGVGVRDFIGSPPSQQDDFKSLFLVFALMPIALAGVWLLWLPLSYVFPELTQEYVLKAQPFLTRDAPDRNAVMIVMVVLLGPIVEEIVFRGILLHRFAHKWGARKAIVVSSIIFGLLHADILGHAVFGIVLSLIYIRTASLWLPIAIHVLNNALALSLMALPLLSTDGDYPLAQFRRDWYVGLIGLAIGLPILYGLRRRYVPPPGWELPRLSVRP